MKTIVVLFVLTVSSLFSQEAPAEILSYGFVRHDDERSQKFWQTGYQYNLQLRIKRTDFGALFAEVGYMNFKLRSKYWQENLAAAPQKRILKIGVATELIKQMRWMELNVFFGIGRLYEKGRIDFGGENYIFKRSSKNQLYYFDGLVGINYRATEIIGFGLNSCYLFAIHGKVRALWFPVTLDTKIYF